MKHAILLENVQHPMNKKDQPAYFFVGEVVLLSPYWNEEQFCRIESVTSNKRIDKAETPKHIEIHSLTKAARHYKMVKLLYG